MLRNRAGNALLADREYVMQLPEVSSVRRDQIIDNHCPELGQLRSNFEKEGFQKFDICHSWTKDASTLDIS